MLKNIFIPLIITISIFGCSTFKQTNEKGNKQLNSENNTWVIETNMGTIKIELNGDKAPLTVARIKELTLSNFFNGIIFHRVIPGFVIQGGDPTGTGTGGSGKSIPDEFDNGLKHDKKGVVAMAHSSLPQSQDSQFYITLSPLEQLDEKYTVFGQVTEGMDVVVKISNVKTGPNDKPIEDVKMIKVTIE